MSYTNARPRVAVAAVAGLDTEQIYLAAVEGGFALALPPDAPKDWTGEIWDCYRSLYPSLADNPPSEEAVAAWQESAPEPDPLSAFEIAVREAKSTLAAREEQAKGDITELKSRVAVTLVATGARMVDDTLITADNVNAEGSRFVVYHAALISAYKDAGGNPEAGQALYNSIASKPSKAAFPWLSDPVLAIFAATLLVESPAP